MTLFDKRKKHPVEAVIDRLVIKPDLAERLTESVEAALKLGDGMLIAGSEAGMVPADEATVRAYRLYLAGAAMCFERGWLALYQLLATLPSEGVPAVRSWARRSDYPYTRAHMLAPQLPPQSCRPGLAPTT